ncbi:hypothetical protein EJ110_NYTH23385 [Nymphaea thermarum]|nr:hypothetical protein EJ110_NYTH23385 [Nymphaea thermarum]
MLDLGIFRIEACNCVCLIEVWEQTAGLLHGCERHCLVRPSGWKWAALVHTMPQPVVDLLVGRLSPFPLRWKALIQYHHPTRAFTACRFDLY